MDEALALTRTTELGDKRYAKLSAGQKRQAQFAIAVVGRPGSCSSTSRPSGSTSGARDDVARDPRPRRARQLRRAHDALSRRSRSAREPRGRAREGASDRAGSVDEIRSVVSRTHISCASALSADDVRRWPSVLEATSDDRKLTITAADGESVVRRLLAADHELRHLEVRPAALSEAFTELTKEAA